MVNDAEEARAIVRATRVPPEGIRGVASVAVRASGFGAVGDYLDRVHEQLCLVMQIETREAFDRIEEIAAVDGVDALFIGPSDLSASMGRSEEHTSELQSLMRISYAVFCLKKKKDTTYRQ